MKVKCLFCKEISDLNDWDIKYEDCELCGSHRWLTCPKCGECDELMYEEVEE